MNVYWIENLEFGNMVAARYRNLKERKCQYFFHLRFLITSQVCQGLKEYNPFTSLDGPWVRNNGKHYVQKTFKGSLYPKRIDLEFMLGIDEVVLHKQ